MSGYDKFFKNAKKQSAQKPVIKNAQKAPAKEPTAEEYLRSALISKSQNQQKAKSAFPIRAVVITVAGIALAATGLVYPDEAASFFSRVELMAYTAAEAADPTKSEEQSAQTNNEKSAESSSPSKGAGAPNCTEVKGFTEEELSHFNKLNERKIELDLRDAELTALEEELHKQKKEVETRILKLEQIRGEVANVLKDKVEVDQQRVSTLVDFYSNMKPKQAADIVKSLNEDLAVEVLSRMKKKNAADIMNLLDAPKARALSEKFTGYKRR